VAAAPVAILESRGIQVSREIPAPRALRGRRSRRLIQHPGAATEIPVRCYQAPELPSRWRLRGSTGSRPPKHLPVSAP